MQIPYNDVLLHISSQPIIINVDGLNSAMVRVFKPQKLANAPSKGIHIKRKKKNEQTALTATQNPSEG